MGFRVTSAVARPAGSLWPKQLNRGTLGHDRYGYRAARKVRMNGQLPRETALLLVALCLVLAEPTHAVEWPPWQRAYDPATRTRFIPVELWTGASWDGTQEIRMAPAAL